MSFLASGLGSLIIDNTQLYDVQTAAGGAVLYSATDEFDLVVQGNTSIHHVQAAQDGGAFYARPCLETTCEFYASFSGNVSLTDNSAQVREKLYR